MIALFLSYILLWTASLKHSTWAKTDNNYLFEHPKHGVSASDSTKQDNIILSTGWYYVVEGGKGVKRKLDRSTDSFFIDPTPIVLAKNFTTLEIFEGDATRKNYIGLAIHLDEAGTENWRVATGKALGNRLAFIIDNRLLQVARVNAQITTGMTVLNRGTYSRDQLEKFKTTIEREK